MRTLAFALVVAVCGCAEKPAATQHKPGPAPVVTPPPPSGPQREKRDIVILTPRAAEQVLRELKASGAHLRVSVENGEYKLHVDPKTDPETDIYGASRGVPIVVDRRSANELPAGVTVDFVNENGRTGFVFQAGAADTASESGTLIDARKGFKTTLARREPRGKAPPKPPADVFRVVKYDAPSGPSSAYLSPDPKDGKKSPAIVWITGGDCNSIDEGCWQAGREENDQSASAYRKAGLVMMFPALRGGNDNPGTKEGFLGEVDDVIAAGEFLRKQSFVDPDRIYLGGHSTGGTLVLLTAECSDRFRAVFSFGPTNDVAGYGPQYNPFVLSDPKELRVRAAGRWLHAVRTPTFVIEGETGNQDALRVMKAANKNSLVTFFEIKDADHFEVLAPINRLIAGRVLRDTAPKCDLAFTEAELIRAMKK